ncbi:GtrA family protein [Nocardia veterana]|uniref:GtrA family protein n=1 Tax=Nocardia veterana TaxID=132249 RepID=UPI0012F645BD|nr:GtrA family protein [Nocardia veterana]
MNSAALAPEVPRNTAWDRSPLRTVGSDAGSTTPWVERVRRSVRGDHAVAQLIRFALVGGIANITYAALFLIVATFGSVVANITAALVSTVIANELHRQLTFRAAGRVGWFTAQVEGGGLALLGVAVSTAALAGLEFWAPGLGEVAQASAVIAVTGVVGGLRFLALRGVVFGPRSRALA